MDAFFGGAAEFVMGGCLRSGRINGDKCHDDGFCIFENRQAPCPCRIGGVGCAAAADVGVGAWRLAQAGETVFHDKVMLRVVQPNIPQHEKWMAEKQAENFQKLLTLSNAKNPADIIIWPETALTADIDAFPAVGTALRNGLPADAVLLTGNIFSRPDEQGREHYYNSLMALNIRTGEKAQYPKSHLVPFGEYVPFRRFVSVAALGALLSGFEDFRR